MGIWNLVQCEIFVGNLCCWNVPRWQYKHLRLYLQRKDIMWTCPQYLFARSPVCFTAPLAFSHAIWLCYDVNCLSHKVLEGKPQYIEFAGNLVPVMKSGDQLQLGFHAFKENRLPFTVRVKDQDEDTVGRILFMREPKVCFHGWWKL